MRDHSAKLVIVGVAPHQIEEDTITKSEVL